MSACLDAWYESRGGAAVSDDQRAVAQVQEFLESHGNSRFQPSEEPQKTVYNRVGYTGEYEGEAEFWVLPEAFRKQLCRGFKAGRVANELKRQGLLRSDKARPDVKVTVKGEDGNQYRPRVYAISRRILEQE